MKAFFMREPRRADDLFRPHLLEQEIECEIVKTVMLEKIDYENFITDMLADRPFIEECKELSAQETVWKCLFVHERGHQDGILITPKQGGYVKWAAYIKEGV